MLALRENSGEISQIRQQVKVYLTRARILYICDYSYFNLSTETTEYVEMKGVETASWRLKRRLWEYYGPGLLAVYKGTYKKPYLDEIIIPKSQDKERSHDFHTEHL